MDILGALAAGSEAGLHGSRMADRLLRERLVDLSEQQDRNRITVFTVPTPLQAGPVDISVLVQKAATEEPASGVQIPIKAE